MTAEAEPIRVLIGKPGLDGHDVGAKVVVRALRDAGMQADYTGLRQAPEAIAERAIKEQVDVVGLSILSGTHLAWTAAVLEELRKRGGEGLTVIVGGNIPAGDRGKLEELGVAGVFPTSTPFEDIVNFLRKKVLR